MAALDPLPHCERSSADYDRPSHPLQQRGRRRPTEERRYSDRRNGKLGFPKRGLGFGYLVAIVQDTQEAAGRSPDVSFGWLGPYGSQVWINPKQQLVTILMIQNSVNAVQRDFEAAVVQARLNQ